MCLPEAFPQSPTRLDVRMGEGRTVTGPASRNFFLAYPVYRLESHFPVIHVDKVVSFSIDHGSVDVVVGIDPSLEIGIPLDDPVVTIEAGVGINLANFNEKDGRQLGGYFFFSPAAGFGVRANEILTVSYLFRHISNAGLFAANEGLNYQYIVFSINLRGL